MWFLVRIVFWLGVVIVLLPTTPSQQKTSTPQIGATDALSAVIAAVSDIRLFCVRQPDACATGSQAIVQFGQKAQAGAKLLHQFLNERIAVDQTAVSTVKPTREPSSGTLTPADLAVPWHGLQPRVETGAKRPT